MDDQNLKDLEREQADNQLIGDAFQHLLDTYLSSRHRKKVDIVTKAFNFARQAHKGVRRLSGEPYIMHPIAVAQIACEEMGLGSTSICAALLHDVVEDTDYTVEDQSPPERWMLPQLPPAVFQLSFGNGHKQHDTARTKHAEDRQIHRVMCTFLEKILRRKPAPRPHDACCHNEKNSDKMHGYHLLL